MQILISMKINDFISVLFFQFRGLVKDLNQDEVNDIVLLRFLRGEHFKSFVN